MVKVQIYNGYVIARSKDEYRYQVFTSEEWSYGQGCRYPEFDDCGNLQECMDNVDSMDIES